MLAPEVKQSQLNRKQRRDAIKLAKRKPRKHNDKTAINPVLCASFEAEFKKNFAILKIQAEQQCIAGNDPLKIAHNAGFLLFVTLRALTLDEMEIEEVEVIEALAIMGDVLGDIQSGQEIDRHQRAGLMTGMDYLDALVQTTSKEANAIAWRQVEIAARTPQGVGTEDLEHLLSRIRAK